MLGHLDPIQASLKLNAASDGANLEANFACERGACRAA